MAIEIIDYEDLLDGIRSLIDSSTDSEVVNNGMIKLFDEYIDKDCVSEKYSDMLDDLFAILTALDRDLLLILREILEGYPISLFIK